MRRGAGYSLIPVGTLNFTLNSYILGAPAHTGTAVPQYLIPGPVGLLVYTRPVAAVYPVDTRVSPAGVSRVHIRRLTVVSKGLEGLQCFSLYGGILVLKPGSRW